MTDVSFYAAFFFSISTLQTQKIGGNPMKAQQRFSRFSFSFIFGIFNFLSQKLFILRSSPGPAGRCCYKSAEQLLRVSVVNNSVMKTPGPSLFWRGVDRCITLIFHFVVFCFSWVLLDTTTTTTTQKIVSLFCFSLPSELPPPTCFLSLFSPFFFIRL